MSSSEGEYVMTTIRRFEDLRAWKKARELTKDVYRISSQGAFAKDFTLKIQIRDAAVGVMHNIAEGFDSGYDSEFIRFLRIARRSATEVQSELYIALDMNYIDHAAFERIYLKADECKKDINAFITYLNKSAK
jgi:four helix bundle protein